MPASANATPEQIVRHHNTVLGSIGHAVIPCEVMPSAQVAFRGLPSRGARQPDVWPAVGHPTMSPRTGRSAGYAMPMIGTWASGAIVGVGAFGRVSACGNSTPSGAGASIFGTSGAPPTVLRAGPAAAAL